MSMCANIVRIITTSENPENTEILFFSFLPMFNEG